MFNDQDYQKQRAERQRQTPNDDRRYRPDFAPEDGPAYDTETGLPLNDDERDRRAQHLDSLDRADRGRDPMDDHSIDGRPRETRSGDRTRSGGLRGFFADGPRPAVIGATVLGVLALTLMIIGLVTVIRFIADWGNDQKTPVSTATAMMDAVGDEDYPRFLSLLNSAAYDVADRPTPTGEGASGTESVADTPEIRALYDDLRRVRHDQATLSDYVIIRQQNGRDILVAVEWNDASDRYEIHDVRALDTQEREVFVY